MDVGEHAIFRALSPERRSHLLRGVRTLSFRKGDLIYPPGGDFGRVYLVSEGEALIGTYSPSGARRIAVAVATTGDIFGDLSFAPGLSPDAGETFAESLTDCQAFCMSTPTFAQCICEEKEALVTLIATWFGGSAAANRSWWSLPSATWGSVWCASWSAGRGMPAARERAASLSTGR